MPINMVIRSRKATPRQIWLRNTTCNDIVVKILNPAGIVQLDRNNVLVCAGKYVVLTTTSPKDLDLLSSDSYTDIQIFARPITPFNKRELREWLSSAEKEQLHHRAQTIHFVSDDTEFAASKVIVDLPGKASLVEPLPRACRIDGDMVQKLLHIGVNDVNTAQTFRVEDINPMMPIRMKDRSKSGRTRDTKEPKINRPVDVGANKRQENCCFLDPLFASLFPSDAPLAGQKV